MLKIDSEQVKKNIRQYITERFIPEKYTEKNMQDFENIAKFIINVFHEENYNDYQDFLYFEDFGGEYAAFSEWYNCFPPPSIFNTCYPYNHSVVDDLKKILEETDAEASKYIKQQAKELLTRLIYRELIDASNVVDCSTKM